MTIRNFRLFNDEISTAGQPTRSELRAAATAGYTDVVNLTTYDSDSEAEREEALVGELGMGYHPIPVEWDAPRPDHFHRFVACMESLRGKKTLVHCAANYRVTAFVSLYAMAKLGWSAERAREFVHTVWDPKKYPVWQQFITQISEELEG